MTPRFLLPTLAAGIITTPLAIAAQQDPNDKRHPNIVLIVADDLGYGDLSCYGQQKFSTPNIDFLARNGIRFTQAYAGTTVSAPSRACLLTGLHSGHAPVRGNIEVRPEGQFPLPSGLPNIFTLLRQAGYVTGAFGKWGLGAPGTSGDPTRQGVDKFFGYNCQLLAHNYYPDHLWDDSTRFPLPENDNGSYGTYAQDLIQQQALKFIRSHKDSTFFLFIPYVLPHAELIVPEDSIIQRFRGTFPETPYHGCDSGPYFRKGGYSSQSHPRATFAAMVSRLDAYVGQVVNELSSLGLLDNTLVIFTSDNGPHREGGADPDFFDSNSIFRGYKRDLYEGGIRIPFIAFWRGTISPRTTDHVCTFWDIFPTLAELTGTQTSPSDGISFLPSLTGHGQQHRHSYLYFEFHEEGGKQAVRKGDWKLIHLNASAPNGGSWELYNLADDPSESDNLIDSHSQKAAALKRLMLDAHAPDSQWPLLPQERTSP